jgi:hypothetical protein
MGVSSNPTGDAWIRENGWRHEVAATAGRWELRVYPDQRPPQIMIADKTSTLRAEASVRREGPAWVVQSAAAIVPAHDAFPDAVAAFRWWVAEVGVRS